MRHAHIHPVLVSALALTLALASPLTAAHAEDPWIAGHWQGTIDAGAQQIRIVYHLSVDDDHVTGTMDVPAQGAYGLQLEDVTLDGRTVSMSFDVPGGGGYVGELDESGDRIDGTFTQGSASLPLALERADATAVTPRRPQEPSAPFPYTVDEVSFPHAEAGIELAGTVTTPRGEGPYPGVVLVSGAGPHDRDGSMAGHKPLLVLADHLTRNGVAVLRFDDRGVGGSGGDLAAATPEDIAGDVLAAVSFLGRLPAVATDRVGLVAHSQGGLAATLAAGETGSVAFLVLLAGPGLSGLDQLERQAQRLAAVEDPATGPAAVVGRIQLALARIAHTETDRDVAARRMGRTARTMLDALPADQQTLARRALPEAAIDQLVGQLNRPSTRFVLSHDPKAALERLTVPVLALFGGKDEQTPFDPNGPVIAAALERSGNTDATVQTISGLNHLFQEVETGPATAYAEIEQTLAPRALVRIGGWIHQRFGGGD